MINLDLSLVVRCNKCNKQTHLIVTENDFNHEIESRSIGEEIEHETILNHVCSHCGSKFRIGIQLSEYPVNQLNYIELYGYGYNKYELEEQLNKNTYTKKLAILEDMSKFNIRYSSCDAGRLWGVGQWCSTCERKCKIYYH